MLLAVHIGDGVLQAPWLIAGFGGAVPFYWVGSRRIRDEEIPRIALLTAVFFIASTIHIPIGKTTSVHLLGNALVGVVLGWRAGLAISVGLLLQAILLQHGGFYVLGVNICVMTLPALAGWLLFRNLQGISWITRPWCRAMLVGISAFVGILSLVYAVVLAATNLFGEVTSLDLAPANAWTFHPAVLGAATLVMAIFVWLETKLEHAPEFPLGLFVGELTVLATATLNCLVLLAGGVYFAGPPLILLVIHLPIAVVEGIILGITVGFLKRVKPEMLHPFSREPLASADSAPEMDPVAVGTCPRSPEGRG